MNESLLRRFCESSHRKLIVAIVTILSALVVMVPLVDDYFDKKESRRAVAERLELVLQTKERLPAIEAQMNRLSEELARLEPHSITESSLNQYRSRLVNLVKETQCSVRQLEVSTPTVRPWIQGDDPLSQKITQVQNDKVTPFSLEHRTVALSVDGSMENIRKFLDKLNKDKTFSFARRLELRSMGQGGALVTVDLELWLFALERQQKS